MADRVFGTEFAGRPRDARGPSMSLKSMITGTHTSRAAPNPMGNRQLHTRLIDSNASSMTTTLTGDAKIDRTLLHLLRDPERRRTRSARCGESTLLRRNSRWPTSVEL